jgi:hypothetical protein
LALTVIVLLIQQQSDKSSYSNSLLSLGESVATKTAGTATAITSQWDPINPLGIPPGQAEVLPPIHVDEEQSVNAKH